MRLLIDENVPDDVAAFFRERGHEVTLVRDVLPGAHDPIIAAHANEAGLTVVTWNHKHFTKLTRQVGTSGEPRFPRMGRISVLCNEVRGRARMEALIGFIEHAYAQIQKREDKRLLMEVSEEWFRVLG